MRCVAHDVTNLSVRQSMTEVYKKARKIRVILAAMMRASVKRRGLFEKCREELDVVRELSNYDSETRWSSSFVMIKRVFKERSVLMAVVNRSEDL